MAKLLEKVSLTMLLLLVCTAASGQEKTLETIAPSVVAKGAPFNVEYRIAANPQRINAPVFENFQLVGSGSSHYTDTRMDGGRRVSETIKAYTYVLVAHEAGNFTIPAASVEVDGKTYTSKPVAIEVVDEGGATTQPGRQGSAQQGGAAQQQGGQAAVSNDDVFIRAIPDKRTVYKGEPVRVIFKLYRRVDIGRVNITKSPALNGFWKRDIQGRNQQPQRENINSKVYVSHVLAEYLLYPTQSGALQIDPMTMDIVIQEMVPRTSRSIFDDLMGGFPEVKETSRTISSPAVTVNVNELPANAPASFNGAVGNFTMDSEVPQGSIYVNSPVTYKIKVSGTGNFPLVQAPKVEMPSSFEQYNSKMTENTDVVPGGLAGSRQFEYPFIARAEGDYRVDPVQFSYFNPQSGEYVTLSSRELHLEVLPDTTGVSLLGGQGGMMSGLSKEDLKILGRDIRFIKHDSPNLRPKGTVLMCSVWYFGIVGLLIAAFVFLLFYLQRRIRQMRDDALVRGKKANKVVLARLKVADEYMKEGNRRRFHDEMLKALWGYLSDKLNIPVANLTKENVREELLKREIPAEQVNRYIDLISECEYAQYSPAESSAMQEKYKAAVEVISKFETLIRR